MTNYNKSIFIFRRDYRCNDNTGLLKALKNSSEVYPIFIYNPIQIDNDKNTFKSNNSVQFMIESLEHLKNNINMQFFYKTDIDVLSEIIKKYKIDAIYTNTDYTPFSVKRDKNLKDFCKKNEIDCYCEHDICLFEPGSINVSSTNQVYKKYSLFRDKCL